MFNYDSVSGDLGVLDLSRMEQLEWMKLTVTNANQLIEILKTFKMTNLKTLQFYFSRPEHSSDPIWRQLDEQLVRMFCGGDIRVDKSFIFSTSYDVLPRITGFHKHCTFLPLPPGDFPGPT